LGRNGCEAEHSSAPQQAAEHGLRLIVHRVPHRHALCAPLRRKCEERCVASFTRVGLPRSPIWDVNREGVERHPELGGKCGCYSHIVCRVGPEAVIDRCRF
jgi:hypothetical protein